MNQQKLVVWQKGKSSIPLALFGWAACLLLTPAWSPYQAPKSTADSHYRGQVAWQSIEDFTANVAQFETVFLEPLDTPSLRKLLRETPVVKGKRVLEIGTGTGLLSLCALQAGALSVVATDINPNARFNAAWLNFKDRFDVRLVSIVRPAAFEVIDAGKQFDVIISNPPWVDQVPGRIQDYALYDASFNLMRTFLDGLPKHLTPGGRVLLAYGAVSGIKMLKAECAKRGYSIKVIDDERDLDKLPEEFLLGMLIEVTLPPLGK